MNGKNETYVSRPIPNDLLAMVDAATKAGGFSHHNAWLLPVIIKAVNAAGLKRADGSDWKWVTPETALEKAERELVELKAKLAELEAKLPPTPPDQRANPETGELEEVA